MEIPGLESWGRLIAETGDQAGQVRLQLTGDQATKNSGDPEALAQSAKEFEGVFLNTLLKAMRRTVPENDLFNGGGSTKFYRQMHDAEIAKSLATGHSGMGIADMIVRQLSPDQDSPTVGVSPQNSVSSPSVPKVLSRYREVIPLGQDSAARLRLTRLAAQQGASVADTLGRFQQEIEVAARQAGLDPALVLSVVMEESGGDPRARSHRGALGLMQLMPDTARELGVRDSLDAAQNLQGGARYLADMLKLFAGKLDVALAAYNAGPGTVERLGGKIPAFPETRRYVRRVLERYEQLGGNPPVGHSKP